MTLLAGHVLSIVLFAPLVGALLLLLIPRRYEAAIRWIANLFGIIGFAASLPLWFQYQPQGAPWQFVEHAEWIPSIGASYFLGVDGLSALLVLLTTLIGAIAILSSWSSIGERIKEYVCLLVLQTATDRALVSLDALLFFLFWEVDARADVFPDRHLGRRASALLRDQVLSLHADRAASSCCSASWRCILRPLGYRRVPSFDIPRFHELTVSRRPADLDFLRLLLRVRREGTDVPAPYVAAGRTHRRTNGGVGHPRRGHAQDGRLRLPAFQSSRVAGGIAPVRAGHGRRSRLSASSTARSSRWRRATGSVWSPIRA